MDRTAIEHLLSRQKVSRWIEKLLRSQMLWWIEIALTSIEKGRSKISIDSLVIEMCREAVEMCKNSFSKKIETQKWMESSMLLNQRSKQHFKLSKTSLKWKFKHMDLQKHTHILNKSNQFYISKTSLRQFSEHTLIHVKSRDGQITLYLHMYQE